MKTWVVVAHRGGARVLLQEDDEKTRVIETLDNPEARIHDRGSAPGHEGGRSARESDGRDASRDHASRPFAHLLAEKLQKGRTDGRYDDLVLIAAPRFLGDLRAALDGATAHKVRGTLDKDYAGLKDRDLIERLDKL